MVVVCYLWIRFLRHAAEINLVRCTLIELSPIRQRIGLLILQSDEVRRLLGASLCIKLQIDFSFSRVLVPLILSMTATNHIDHMSLRLLLLLGLHRSQNIGRKPNTPKPTTCRYPVIRTLPCSLVLSIIQGLYLGLTLGQQSFTALLGMGLEHILSTLGNGRLCIVWRIGGLGNFVQVGVLLETNHMSGIVPGAGRF